MARAARAIAGCGGCNPPARKYRALVGFLDLSRETSQQEDNRNDDSGDAF
jgi:hypothetical protein